MAYSKMPVSTILIVGVVLLAVAAIVTLTWLVLKPATKPQPDTRGTRSTGYAKLGDRYYTSPAPLSLLRDSRGGIYQGSYYSSTPLTGVPINTAYERVGILITNNTSDDTVLTVFGRPIIPANDLYSYYVVDKDGIRINLTQTYIVNGDVISSVPGKESLGAWTFKDETRNVWAWMS